MGDIVELAASDLDRYITITQTVGVYRIGPKAYSNRQYEPC